MGLPWSRKSRGNREDHYQNVRRNCHGIAITFMHLIFRPSLPDPQLQNPQNSAAIPTVLLNQISQIWPQSERLNAIATPWQLLTNSCWTRTKNTYSQSSNSACTEYLASSVDLFNVSIWATLCRSGMTLISGNMLSYDERRISKRMILVHFSLSSWTIVFCHFLQNAMFQMQLSDVGQTVGWNFLPWLSIPIRVYFTT